MVVALKVRRFGNSQGVILPREELDRMQVELGDTVYLTRAPGGSRLTAYDPQFEAQMDAARRIMKKRRGALRELAK